MKERLQRLALSTGLAVSIGGVAASGMTARAEALNTEIPPVESAKVDAGEEEGSNWETNPMIVGITIGGLAAVTMGGLYYISRKSEPKNNNPNG